MSPQRISGVLENLLRQEAESVAKRYRITADQAYKIIQETFSARPDLNRKIQSNNEEEIVRLGFYTKLIKESRKKVYYFLRRYHAEEEQESSLHDELRRLAGISDNRQAVADVCQRLLNTHLSTRERCPHYEAFYQSLFSMIPRPRTILDVGCGLHPMSYPFYTQNGQIFSLFDKTIGIPNTVFSEIPGKSGSPGISEKQELPGKPEATCSEVIEKPGSRGSPEIYVALDKDPKAIETLTLFSSCFMPSQWIPLTPLRASFSEAGWTWTKCLPGTVPEFDFAFMLKLIPIIYRQSEELLPILAQVPARNILITASTEAMTRKKNIQRREEHALQEFMGLTGKNRIGTFQIRNEFGYLLG